jgi:mannose-6-phosphate isomerase
MKLNRYFEALTKLDIPIVIDPNNFTPESRTPWGGFAIAKHFKRHLEGNLINEVPERIGESWELSLDPSFPSKALIDGSDLGSIIKKFPEDVFSKVRIEKGGGECKVLVKILEAKDPLSLQVHPDDKDPDLKPHECGKPESWLVLHADKGAGIYLGFRSPMTKNELKGELLKEGENGKNCLQFVPVQVGQYFEIGPGVPHAIGPGVVIMEPQRVLPSREGKTFRLWDWGRLYQGKPRELHFDQGMKLIDPQLQCGESFVNTLIRRGDKLSKKRDEHSYEKITYPPNEEYQTTWLRAESGVSLPCSVDGGFAIMTVVRGQIRIRDRHGQHFTLGSEWTEHNQGQTAQSKSFDPFLVRAGMTAFLPHSIFPIHLELNKSETPEHETPETSGHNFNVECVFVVPTPSLLSI